MELTFSVKLGIIFSGVYLWIGMLTGVWKYLQMRKSAHSRAHYYVDIAHRSSLLYAPAALILAVMAYFSLWSEVVNLFCVFINVVFFSASIAAYIVHGFLQDTSNQFKVPHQLGRFHLAKWMMTGFMIALIIAELLGTAILIFGVMFTFF